MHAFKFAIAATIVASASASLDASPNNATDTLGDWDDHNRHHHGDHHMLEEAAREIEKLHHEVEELEDHEHHHRQQPEEHHHDHHDEHQLLEDASWNIDELHDNIEKLEDHEHHHHDHHRDDEADFLEAKKAAHAAGRKALRGAARVPTFIEDPTNDCSNKGTCGNAYQACCIAFQLKGYPCGCHLADGTGKVGANCGDCGTAFSVCCIAETCKCDIA